MFCNNKYPHNLSSCLCVYSAWRPQTVLVHWVFTSRGFSPCCLSTKWPIEALREKWNLDLYLHLHHKMAIAFLPDSVGKPPFLPQNILPSVVPSFVPIPSVSRKEGVLGTKASWWEGGDVVRQGSRGLSVAEAWGLLITGGLCWTA